MNITYTRYVEQGLEDARVANLECEVLGSFIDYLLNGGMLPDEAMQAALYEWDL